MKKFYTDKTEYRNEKGQLHRTDGPAVIHPDGSKEYWIYSKRVTFEVISLINQGLSEIEALEICIL